MREIHDPLTPVADHHALVHRCGLWWRKPSCWRDDYTWDENSFAVSVVCDECSSSYISVQQAFYSNCDPHDSSAALQYTLAETSDFQLPLVESRQAMIPLLHGSYFTHGWNLALIGEYSIAGRAGLLIRAERAATSGGPPYWDYVDQYELVADRERGVLLRYAAIIDNREMGSFTVSRVEFDQRIPDEVFTFAPPPGTRFVRARLPPQDPRYDNY